MKVIYIINSYLNEKESPYSVVATESKGNIFLLKENIPKGKGVAEFLLNNDDETLICLNHSGLVQQIREKFGFQDIVATRFPIAIKHYLLELNNKEITKELKNSTCLHNFIQDELEKIYYKL